MTSKCRSGQPGAAPRRSIWSPNWRRVVSSRKGRRRVASKAGGPYVPESGSQPQGLADDPSAGDPPMSDSEFTRRDFLVAVAGASVTTWLSASWSDLNAAGTFAASASQQEGWQVLKPEQVRELDAVTAQLVPTDNTPGAREAHVVRFMDRSLATYAKAQRPAFDAALKKLDELVASHFPGATSFASLGDAEQITVLKDWEATDGQTFGTIHGATIV